MKKMKSVIGINAFRKLIKRISLVRNAITNINSDGSDAVKTEHDDHRTSPFVAKHIKTYYCSEFSVFVEWGRKSEMEIITDTDRIIYSKRVRPETYPLITPIQWQ